MIPSASSVSFLTGLWFVFDVEGTQVALWASALTGKEELYVAGQKVSEARRMRRTSAHRFTLEGAEYTLDLGVVSQLRCKYACTLLRDGVAVQRQVTQYKRSPLEGIAWGALLAVVLYALLELDLALWLGMGLVLAALAAFLHGLARRAFEVVPVPPSTESAFGG
jgi:hypothetical protein